MNQAECAEALDLSEATVSRYVSGERMPSLNTMYRIRDLLLWSIEAQADAVRCGTYAAEFAEKMERRQTRRRVVDTQALRGVQPAGLGGPGVPALETGEQNGEKDRVGEGAGTECGNHARHVDPAMHVRQGSRPPATASDDLPQSHESGGA